MYLTPFSSVFVGDFEQVKFSCFCLSHLQPLENPVKFMSIAYLPHPHQKKLAKKETGRNLLKEQLTPTQKNFAPFVFAPHVLPLTNVPPYLFFSQNTPPSPASFFLSGFSFTNIHNSQDSRGRGRPFFLTPLYHFHPLHRYLDISRAITAESSPLHIASSQTQTGTFGFRVQVANH